MNCLITGTSSGLGTALARDFEALDCFVMGTTHDQLEIGDLQFLYNAEEPEFSSRELAQSVQRELAEQGGKLNVLINNAGVNKICRFEDLTGNEIYRIMTVNFVAPVLLTQALLPFLAPGGVVCNIISDASWRPMRHSLAYNCSKAALAMATKQMARELTKPHNLTIFGVNPGKLSGTRMSEYIDGQVMEMRQWTAQQAADYYKQNSLTGRETTPEVVARIISSLIATPALTKNLSGAVIDLVG